MIAMIEPRSAINDQKSIDLILPFCAKFLLAEFSPNRVVGIRIRENQLYFKFTSIPWDCGLLNWNSDNDVEI